MAVAYLQGAPREEGDGQEYLVTVVNACYGSECNETQLDNCMRLLVANRGSVYELSIATIHWHPLRKQGHTFPQCDDTMVPLTATRGKMG